MRSLWKAWVSSAGRELGLGGALGGVLGSLWKAWVCSTGWELRLGGTLGGVLGGLWKAWVSSQWLGAWIGRCIGSSLGASGWKLGFGGGQEPVGGIGVIWGGRHIREGIVRAQMRWQGGKE